MAFLNRIFRNRGLLENLGREPLAPIPEPIAPRPIATPFVPPQPVLPFPERLPDPFERLPMENPRNNFLSIQRLDDTPPIQSPLKQLVEKIQNQQMPVFLPSPVTPPQPPSIGGINQDVRPLEKPIIPPKRNDFISINRVNSDDLRQRQALGLTGVPGVGSNNFGGTPLGQQPIIMDSGPQTTGMRTLKDTRDYANMTDDEIRKIMGPNPTVPGRSPKPISQEQIDEFRFDKLNPGMLFEMIQNRDISPDDYDDPLAKKIATRLQESERKRREFFENNPVTPPVAPPPPDGTPENPFPLQPILPAPTDDRARLPGPPLQATPAPTIDPVIEPAPTTPAAVASDVGAVPVTTIPQDVRGQVDPVLAQQDTQEILTDPLLRALYFGTADQPGFINQLQQATANLIASDVPLQETAGLSELELLARQRALADLGVAEPFVGESADLIRGTTRQFDPSMTQQFFNPFEDQVVQQTIQDVLEAGEKRDIAQRARDIQTGGLSAFGSRARLTAADRQEALGRGLAEALGGIRQAGFGQAQRDAITTFAQQRQAEQQAARDLGQVGSTLADLRARERAGLAGFGQTGRDIEETGLSRLFKQQLDQQGRPLTALQLTGQLLPQFQAGSTQIDSEYRLPVDPTQRGLGAALSTFTALAPGQTTDLSKLGAAFSGYGTSS